MVFALSTSWNAFRHTSGTDLIFEIKGLGFEEVELSFSLTASMVGEIERLVRDKLIRISSIHNYCPIPEGMPREKALPDCFSMASLAEEERQRAVKQAKNTIETACRLEAQAVVLHCGRVEVIDRTRDLIELAGRGLIHSREYSSIKSLMQQERLAKAGSYFQSALKSLEELCRFAQTKQVLLGIENRFYFREIPSPQEITTILNTFRGSPARYWHDVGHAFIQDRLGLIEEQLYFKQFAATMCGIHLHDIDRLQDHVAPGQGEYNFTALRPYMAAHTIKVIEAHHPATAEQLKKGVALLQECISAAK